MVQHEIPPVFDENSRVLVLGSFPSVQSRKAAFFYGHPQNRFWRVLSAVFGEPVPGDVPEKKALLLKHKVALWDVIASCDVTGSADASIKNVVPNDLSVIFIDSEHHACVYKRSNGAQAVSKISGERDRPAGNGSAEHQPRERRVELGAADGSVEDYPINLIRQARGFKNRVLFSPIFSLSI